MDDLADESDYDEGPDAGADYSEPVGSKTCHHCHAPPAFETCGICGVDLCPACFEMGGGFCHRAHTYEEVCDYEDSLLGPPDAQKLQQRQARRELVALGILKAP